MTLVSLQKRRFGLLTSELTDMEWQWLTVLAAEERLGVSALLAVALALAERGTFRAALLETWLTRNSSNGLLQAAGLVPVITLRQVSGGREPAFSVASEFRQWVLRGSHERGRLAVVVTACQNVLGERSLARLALLVQTGERGAVERWTVHAPKTPQLRPTSNEVEDPQRRVCDAICSPFDADWFVRTFRKEALAMALWVLRVALPRLDPCTALYDWVCDGAGASLAERTAMGADLSLASVVCQHAVLRGDIDILESRVTALPAAPRLAFQAAARYLQGDAVGALDVASQSVASANRRARGERFDAASLRPSATGSTSTAGATLPLLALLLCSTETDEGVANAKRLLNARGVGDDLGGAARAFRTLLRYATEPEAPARIDAYQLPPLASAWEILLLGLTVQLYLEQEVTRSAWSKLLLQRGLEWQARGYSWLGRQALFIAQALDARLFAEEFERERPGALPLECGSRELLLRDLITPKADWEKTLDALAQLSIEAEGDVERAYRVAWFVDMAAVQLRRPALQEFRTEQGWSTGRRVSLQEAYERRAELPQEDARVLRCTSEDSDHKRDYLPEAWEALTGHPRVFNGARGEELVEVVLGQCRVTAEESRGYLEIAVEPPHAELGVNVRAEGERRVVVYRVTPALQRVISVLPHGLRVPKNEERRALAVLGKLSQAIEVQSPLLGEERVVVSNPTPCLRISPHAGAWLVQAGVRPFGARGQFFIAATGRRNYVNFSEGQKLRTERDFHEESRQLSQLIAECPTLLYGTFDEEAARAPGEPIQNWVLSHEGVLGLLAELRDVSAPCELEWPESSALRVRGRVTTKNLQGLLRRNKGWYLATGGMRIDDVTELALSELVSLPTLAGGRFVQLPNGDFVEVEARVRRVMAALALSPAPARGALELKIHESSLHVLQLLSEQGSGFEWDQAARSWLARVEQVREQSFELPETLHAELRPYQLEGFRFLARLTELSLGACLADDMGLGKTVQILALLLLRVSEGPVLVVAPTSVCSNWMTEIARFAPSLAAIEYSGADRPALLAELKANLDGPRVLICSYTLLQQDADILADVEWGTVVLDEAQFIKNPASRRALAAFRLSAKYRIAATGTPVENHLGDLWSIFHFLNPALLGPWRAFDRRFVKPIERHADPLVQAELQKHVQPYILRRLKSQVLADLPPITTVRHEVRLSEAETLRYALLRRQIHDKLHTSHGKRQNKLEILAEIMRLRRFCCHPRLVFPDAEYEASKVETFLQLVHELRESDHRALVFSQFTDFLGMVRERLDEQGITYEYLDGSTPKQARQARVEAFQSGSAPLFLISLKAGGFGLNLTAADYVIHLDPWWNPAVEAQATDRAHRIGQEKPVTVYRLITKDTIEESIVALHQEKRRLADALLAGTDGEFAGGVDTADLLALIGQGFGP